MAFLDIKNLKVSYGKINVIENFTCQIQEGKITFLCGDNAAGKTTILKSIIKINNYEGEISIEGLDIKRDNSYKKDVGYIFQEIILYDKLTVNENLKIFGKILKVKNLNFQIDEMLKKFNLTEYKDTKIKHCSGGTKRKTHIIASILHDPKFIIMDEPTESIDRDSIEKITNYFIELNNKGVTFLIVSHDINFIDKFKGAIHIEI